MHFALEGISAGLLYSKRHDDDDVCVIAMDDYSVDIVILDTVGCGLFMYHAPAM